MGRQTNIKLSGTVENVIYYKSRGEFYIRSKPQKVKRLPVAIKNSGIFGMSARCSCVLRTLLAPILPMPASRTIMYRVNRAFNLWLRTGPFSNTDQVDAVPSFNGLSLHPQNELGQFFKVPVTVIPSGNGQLQVQLPAFDPVLLIKAPVGTTQVQLQIAVAALKMDNSSLPDFFKTDLSLDYIPGMLAARECDLPMDTFAGRLLTVAISLQYFTNNYVAVNQLTWKPAGIVGSFYN
jgi:hypothetical protein